MTKFDVKFPLPLDLYPVQESIRNCMRSSHAKRRLVSLNICLNGHICYHRLLDLGFSSWNCPLILSLVTLMLVFLSYTLRAVQGNVSKHGICTLYNIFWLLGRIVKVNSWNTKILVSKRWTCYVTYSSIRITIKIM